ncbi:MAG: hypothetical protein QM692_16350 [Thermomicrobiales bacterium]
MDQGRFKGVMRVLSGVSSRRMAISGAAISGLALANHVAAKDDVTSEGKKRGRRGKKGKQGPAGATGPAGPLAGSQAVVVSNPCNFGAVASGGEGTTTSCEVDCPTGFVATGGGYRGPAFTNGFGLITGSEPDPNADNQPTGWIVTVEYIDFGQGFDVTAYAVCVPA